MVDLYLIIDIYRYFSIIFHIGIVLFFIYAHFLKPKRVKIHEYTIEGVGIITLIMGAILYKYGNFIINQN